MAGKLIPKKWLAANVFGSDTDDCIIWPRPTLYITVAPGRQRRVQVVVYEATHGQLPPRANCFCERNASCVNPRHLKWRKPRPLQPTDRFKRHGITQGDYDWMFDTQAGRCAVCRHALTAKTRICIDHSHSTGNVRGLLCQRCNSRFIATIDAFISRPELLTNAVGYIPEFAAIIPALFEERETIPRRAA